MPVFEVFTQAREGKPYEHGGNIVAPDSELAILYAREFYGRRAESVRIWVVPREAIIEINDPDILESTNFTPPVTAEHRDAWTSMWTRVKAE